MDDIIVYATSHGEKYHIDKNCTFIYRNRPFPIYLNEAIMQQKQPCKGCSQQNNNNYQK